MDNHKIQIFGLKLLGLIQAIIVLIIVWYATTGYYYAMCQKNRLSCQNDKAKEIYIDGYNKAKTLLQKANY